ncbi:MAG: F420-0--gamma-glutamyl ligase [Candidatus Pacebacteria bacterium]|nr:F420-0--gamma-glutamyl ligase [Candidatus Paceibacterota bacterium]
MELTANPGKNLIIKVDGIGYARYPVKTCLITPEHKDLAGLVRQYTTPYLREGDIVFMGEKAIAVSQGRSYHKDSIKPSRLAKFLVRFVTKTTIGVGISSAPTMQLAIEEVGVPRMLLAALVAALTKPFGVKGAFYLVAGEQARSIDGAADYVIPPYNNYVSKGPKDAVGVAQKISDKLGYPFVIVDVCDFGAHVLGASKGVDKKMIERILRDNPLCQTNEQTPIGILRKISQ